METPYIVQNRAPPKLYIKVHKTKPSAEDPKKEHPSDIGWDLHLIERTDERAEDTVGALNKFSTGLRIEPPPGYYVEIVARSSLQNYGYMLGNGVGIIDPDYRGEVIVSLYKFREGDDLGLPLRAVQMILRKVEPAYLSLVTSLGRTDRGAGGFGSTGYYAPSGMNGGGDRDEGGYIAGSGSDRRRVTFPPPAPASRAVTGGHLF